MRRAQQQDNRIWEPWLLPGHLQPDFSPDVLDVVLDGDAILDTSLLTSSWLSMAKQQDGGSRGEDNSILSGDISSLSV